MVACLLGVALGVFAFPGFRPFQRFLFGFFYFLAFITLSALQNEVSNQTGWNILVGCQVAIVVASVVALLPLMASSLELPAKPRWFVTCGTVCIGLSVAYFSGPQGGAGKFMWFLQHVIGLGLNAATDVNFVVRKAIHLGTYGLLALSASRAVAGQGGSASRSLMGGYLWSVLHAVYDETTQAGVVTRSGSPWDVLLDIVGMTLFLWPLIVRIRREGAE